MDCLGQIWKMKINVSRESWLYRPEWLFEGRRLWNELSEAAGLQERDYMLPKQSPGLEGLSRATAKYDDVVQASQMMFGALMS